MDFDPSKWGPQAWAFLHMLTFSYPEQPRPDTRAEFRAFFRALCTVLPCAKCRRHYADNFSATAGEEEGERGAAEDPFASRESLTRWLIDMHNRVNAAQGKPKLPADQARRLYTAQDLLCNNRAGGAPAPPSPRCGKGAPETAVRSAAWLYPLLCLLLVCVGGLLAALVHRRCWA